MTNIGVTFLGQSDIDDGPIQLGRVTKSIFLEDNFPIIGKAEHRSEIAVNWVKRA